MRGGREHFLRSSGRGGRGYFSKNQEKRRKKIPIEQQYFGIYLQGSDQREWQKHGCRKGGKGFSSSWGGRCGGDDINHEKKSRVAIKFSGFGWRGDCIIQSGIEGDGLWKKKSRATEATSGHQGTLRRGRAKNLTRDAGSASLLE